MAWFHRRSRYIWLGVAVDQEKKIALQNLTFGAQRRRLLTRLHVRAYDREKEKGLEITPRPFYAQRPLAPVRALLSKTDPDIGQSRQESLAPPSPAHRGPPSFHPDRHRWPAPQEGRNPRYMHDPPAAYPQRCREGEVAFHQSRLHPRKVPLGQFALLGPSAYRLEYPPPGAGPKLPEGVRHSLKLHIDLYRPFSSFHVFLLDFHPGGVA